MSVGTSAATRLGLATLLLIGASCASNTPQRRSWSPGVSRDLLTHFRIDEATDGMLDPSSTGGALISGERTSEGPQDLGPLVLGNPSTASTSADDDGPASERETLSLETVLRSVETNFPLVLAAFEEVEIAAGKLESAAGAFDTKVKAKGKFETEGFYENDQIDFAIEQPTTLWGARVEGGYRRGDGNFAVYDGKAKTNTEGELRLGVMVPLLQGRRIDPQRIKLLQGGLEQDKADPVILEKRLAATRKAAESYWKWMAFGQKRVIARNLLDLAETRQDQIQSLVTEGELAEINLIDNERLIVDRTTKLQRADQDLTQAAIGLSLYWRDETGRPLVASLEDLPSSLPAPRPLPEILVVDDELLALKRRPELRQVELELESLRLDSELAENQLLPNVDVGLFGSQDYGSAVNTPDDKEEFELEAILRFELPLQRRKARGAQRTAEAKISKLEQESRFLANLVVSEVREAVNVLEQTLARLGQARRNVELARQLEQAERVQLLHGESDLFRVNVREQQSAVAAQNLVEILAEHYFALAGYRAVLGLPYDEVLAGEPLGGPR